MINSKENFKPNEKFSIVIDIVEDKRCLSKANMQLDISFFLWEFIRTMLLVEDKYHKNAVFSTLYYAILCENIYFYTV